MIRVPGLRLIGTTPTKASVLSFCAVRLNTPEQVGKALNQEGIAVRAGHHCAQPISAPRATGSRQQFALRWPCTTLVEKSTGSSMPYAGWQPAVRSLTN